MNILLIEVELLDSLSLYPKQSKIYFRVKGSCSYLYFWFAPDHFVRSSQSDTAFHSNEDWWGGPIECLPKDLKTEYWTEDLKVIRTLIIEDEDRFVMRYPNSNGPIFFISDWVISTMGDSPFVEDVTMINGPLSSLPNQYRINSRKVLRKEIRF